MAGGKLSPRQKMINMMYLVLTALLALNISKEILEAFIKVNESTEQTTSRITNTTASLYSEIKYEAGVNPERAKPIEAKANKVKAEADAAYDFIEEIKQELYKRVDAIDEEGNIDNTKLDNKEKAAEYLLVQKKGDELKDKLDAYREFMKSMTESSTFKDQLDVTFDTEAKMPENGDVKIPWVERTFEHYPLAPIVAFLSQQQNDIRNAESVVVGELKSKIKGDVIPFDAVNPIAMAPSNYILVGDSFKSEIFMAAYDSKSTPEITVYALDADSNVIGDPIKVEDIKNGKGFFSQKTTSTGVYNYAGVIKIPGDKVDRRFKFGYTVAEAAVVISPTEMNVLYRGVDNPLEISIPGVPPEDLTVTGTGGARFSGSGGKYKCNVLSVRDREINISVSANGQSFPPKKFRVKRIPPPGVTILNKKEGTMSVGAIKNNPLKASIEDFPYDIKFSVKSFTITFTSGGSPQQFKINGDKVSGTARTLLESARPGSPVSFTNIKVQAPDGIKDASNPISLTID